MVVLSRRGGCTTAAGKEGGNGVVSLIGSWAISYFLLSLERKTRLKQLPSREKLSEIHSWLAGGGKKRGPKYCIHAFPARC